MHLSSTLERFSEPETLKMAKLGRELRSQGLDIIDLSLGEPDFDTPVHIKEAAKRAIDENYSHYTPVSGYVELRTAISAKLKRDNDLTYTPEQIVVSTGAKQSIANAVLALIEKGDEVIIPTPYWCTYSAIVQLAMGTCVFINATSENGYKITPGQLEEAITPRTRMFIFSTPCNPSGAVYSKDELAGLVTVFEKFPEVYIISDEIYEYINYVGKHESIAQFTSLKERVVVVNGMSKGFAMTGWRLGYMASSTEIAKACEKIQGQFTSAPNSIAQRASIVALTDGLEPTFKMVKEFERRGARVMQFLKELPLIECSKPDGAFYVFPRVDKYFGLKYGDKVISSASDLCMYLLNEAHVSTVTGHAFGDGNCIRLSFANNMENIEKGLSRIKDKLSLLKR